MHRSLLRVERLLLLAALTVGFAASQSASAETKPAADAAQKTAAPKPDKDGWYSLFNGKDFTGWKLSKENKETFRIENGEIIAKGLPAHAYYEGPVNKADFKNFELKVDVLTKPNSNGGVYFHTEYQDSGWPAHGIECQVNNTHSDPRKTASFYRMKDVMDTPPAKDNEWFTLHVIVKDRHLVAKVNDKVVNEHVEPEGAQRKDGFEKNLISHGTFALQGHDPGSEVHFKNILVKPLP